MALGAEPSQSFRSKIHPALDTEEEELAPLPFASVAILVSKKGPLSSSVFFGLLRGQSNQALFQGKEKVFLLFCFVFFFQAVTDILF
jgi:hypothetical protein